MPDRSNLLIALHNWPSPHDENFTTEAFSHLLRYLLKHEPNSGRRLIEVIAGEEDPPWLPLSECENVEVTTQVSTKGHGRPDIRIQGEGFCIYVEVKVRSGVSQTQLKKYKKGLAKRTEVHKQLILLENRSSSPEDIPAGVFRVYWSQLHERLEELLETENLLLRPEALFLVRQVLGFFEYQHFSPLRQVKEIKSGFESYLIRIKRKKELSVFAKKSVEALKGEEELVPLYNLVGMMGKVGSSSRFTTNYAVAHKTEWVGWNIGNMEYFFFIWFEEPEVVLFQKYGQGVDRDKWKDGRGEIEEAMPNWFTWINKLDLKKRGFFLLSKDGQECLLKEFFDKSLAYAEETWGS